MSLSILHLNRIQMLMIKINIIKNQNQYKTMLFQICKIRAEGYSTLITPIIKMRNATAYTYYEANKISTISPIFLTQ